MMAVTEKRKQITFDLCQESLKLYYPHASLSDQYYKKAYQDIRRFMTDNGFEHRQHSVYISTGKLTTLDVVQLIERLAEAFPWLNGCVDKIDAADIGTQHSLKQTLEAASRRLDINLDHTPLAVRKTERPALPKTGKQRKRSRLLER